MAKVWAMVTSMCSDFLQVAKLGMVSPMGRRMLRTGSFHPDFRGKERQGVVAQPPPPSPRGHKPPRLRSESFSQVHCASQGWIRKSEEV